MIDDGDVSFIEKLMYFGKIIPDTVREKAREFQIEISLEQWQKLPPSQRFALIKLSRPGHENLNFYPALKEFHIVDA